MHLVISGLLSSAEKYFARLGTDAAQSIFSCMVLHNPSFSTGGVSTNQSQGGLEGLVDEIRTSVCLTIRRNTRRNEV